MSLKKLEKYRQENWDLTKGKIVNLKDRKLNVKKPYHFGHSKQVVLLILKDPIDGFEFLVLYEPTGVYFGFNNYRDAETFARLRVDHINSYIKRGEKF